MAWDTVSMLVNSKAAPEKKTDPVDEVECCRGSAGISARQESEDVCWVVYALDGKTASSPQAVGKSIEERRALGAYITDISLLCRAACVDDSHGTARGAIGELVVSSASVLTLGNSGCGIAVAFKLTDVFINGKIRVEQVSDGKADALCGCWCSERGGAESRDGEK
ncbi:hypothetical protein IAQ61_001213 [Plenodomus lingam]|uniref:uncharacterized protein n=1 Tax=Leptosphaeria maculans TaxID=5022 RepID=UPI003326F7DA|nr:hypothetical protein IAQ61_001213 [Plenodomus lingam]